MDKLSPSKNFVCVVPPQNNSVDSRCFVCNKYYLENIFLKDKFHIDDSVGYSLNTYYLILYVRIKEK